MGNQLKERYGKDPSEVDSLIPPLPLPGTEKAADCLAVITECFKLIAEDLAEKEAAAKAEKAAKPSMFHFTSSSGAKKPAPAVNSTPTAASETAKRAEEKEMDPASMVNTAAKAEKSIYPADSTADAAEGSKEGEDGEAAAEVAAEETENENEELSAEDAARLAAWDEECDKEEDGPSSTESSRTVHLADDFKYWYL